MINHQLNLEDLAHQINNLRYIMIDAGLEHGLSSPETLRYSEELDELILQFQVQNR